MGQVFLLSSIESLVSPWKPGLESSSVGPIAISRVLLQPGPRQVSYPGTFFWVEEASLGLGRSNKGLKFFDLAGPLKPYDQQLLKILGNRIKHTDFTGF